MASGQDVARRWARTLPTAALLTTEDAATAVASATEALRTASVGMRIAVAGSVGACLQVRAALLAAGAEEDEMDFQATEHGPIDIFCAHCSTSTATHVGVDGLVPCDGCGRTLIVYHHVSRRLGKYLGFQADAETLPGNSSLTPPASEVLS
ncbi:dimethylamine monooxygenase subunit DmmA family protein [Mycobacterium kyogaense]|uniref:dimethylamine monooxygenase subunit DmmA family protein n=1 Tax=Mycobacterium kyogaense TaxID=2212479 RepID=UPI001F092104|nr:dimethylamine monooxygenase subunit DmmA family protein [Mycobacterium kyogaense]